MKKVLIILALVFVVIAACMLYLVRTGVSLRSAPLIRPSVVGENQKNIPAAFIIRMFPAFQNAQFVLWGVTPEDEEFQSLFRVIQDDFEKLFKKPVQVIPNAERATLEELKSCNRPCWLLLPKDQAHELSTNAFINEKIKPLAEDYITITYIPFERSSAEVSQDCEKAQRISLDCIKPLLVRESLRKMKESDQRYFFLRKYQDRDHFLFIEQVHQ